jgi:serine/threonine protein kinase
MKQPGRCPYVEPLIFLSAADIDVRLKPEGRIGVVTRKELLAAVQHHKFPGANPNWRGERIDKPTMHDVAQSLAALGLRPRKGRAYAGSYELGELLAEGAGYQDRAATHRDRGFKTRARVYLVPQQASVERRQQLRRAAERESTLLWDVREHPAILRIADYVTDAPLGPTVLFDDFAGGVPLDAFLRQNPSLSFEERLAIVEQVGRALAHCHRKSIIHGAVAPQCVLVRRHPDTNTIDVRLFNFQLGAGRDVDVTQHWSALAHESWAVYQAPELRENPLARSPQSDIFSLGALAYFTFTGRAPAERVEDIDRRLAKERYLDPRAVDDAVRGRMAAEVFAFATDVAPVNRADNVEEWLELLLDVATAPEEKPVADQVDPLEATRGTVLDGDLEVQKVLGTGATARVLQVRRLRDDRLYALKVASDAAHHERLSDEALVLKNLPKHPRIVDLLGEVTIKERECLLLSLAGEQTLQQKLARFGPVSLDEASRYGDDLLLALEHLEEHQVLHRDIKPANLGVGSVSNVADHLTVFDFSLARLPVSEVQVGTAVYRDPYLRAEGRKGWDFHADRWSAAITLHEMLAGTRPSFSGGSAIDPDARIVLAAERFDAAVRDELVHFFEKAFARSAADRFPSAQTMRHAWVAIVGTPARAAKSKAAAAQASEPEIPELTDAEVAKIEGETPVAALPLSLRARNALDRAGLTRTQDLLGLADNRLSAIRGVGRLVAKEILDFRDRWSRLRPLGGGDLAPFFPGYGGDDLDVRGVAIEVKVAAALIDGGLPTLRAVAQAPDAHLASLAKRYAFDPAVLRKVLGVENERANERAQPTTLEGWIEALLPRRRGRKDRHLVRALYGLDVPFEGRLDVTVRELASKENKTPAGVYIALGKARDDWAAHAALPELRDRLTTLVESTGGAATLAALGDEVARVIPRGSDAPPDVLRAMAAALFRVVAEVDKEAPTGLRVVRLHDREPWVFLGDDHARITRQLGSAADALAARATLAATGEVRRLVAEIVGGTPLAAVKEERLLELAAAASEHAACSARLEIYPRALDPKRAVELCAATFKGGVSENDVRARVALRYPQAAPLPARPELDALLSPLGFVWNDAGGAYLRPGEEQGTTLQTRQGSSLGRASTALPSQARAMDPEAIDARQFDEKLKHAVEMRAFRVLGVTAERARDAALALQSRLDAAMVRLDVELAKEVAVQMKKANIPSDDVVHAADREGPAGPHWGKLLKLVQAAAGALAARLASGGKPLLLVQPGPIARYGLNDFLHGLVEMGTNRQTPAIFLLVPMHDTGGVPRIGGSMPVPGIVPGQAMWVSRAWLSNRHNAAA